MNNELPKGNSAKRAGLARWPAYVHPNDLGTIFPSPAPTPLLQAQASLPILKMAWVGGCQASQREGLTSGKVGELPGKSRKLPGHHQTLSDRQHISYTL